MLLTQMCFFFSSSFSVFIGLSVCDFSERATRWVFIVLIFCFPYCFSFLPACVFRFFFLVHGYSRFDDVYAVIEPKNAGSGQHGEVCVCTLIAVLLALSPPGPPSLLFFFFEEMKNREVFFVICLGRGMKAALIFIFNVESAFFFACIDIFRFFLFYYHCYFKLNHVDCPSFHTSGLAVVVVVVERVCVCVVVLIFLCCCCCCFLYFADSTC